MGHSGKRDSSSKAASERVERSIGLSSFCFGSFWWNGLLSIVLFSMPVVQLLLIDEVARLVAVVLICQRSGARFANVKRMASRLGATVFRVTISDFSRRSLSGPGSYVRLTSCMVKPLTHLANP